MFVPSLPWSNDAFYLQTAQKWRFFTGSAWSALIAESALRL
eukprot:COSAG06_NODE_431_length_15859_cov_19.762500_10_plen_41_part_00